MRHACACLALLALACGAAEESTVDPSTVDDDRTAESDTEGEASSDQAPVEHLEVDETTPGDTTTTVEYAPGVPAYPGARYLCAQHVTAADRHIEWRGYATTDDLATVRAFYEARFYAPGAVETPAMFERDPDGDGFQITADDRVITAHVVGGGHPTCDVAPAAGERTFLVVSLATP